MSRLVRQTVIICLIFHTGLFAIDWPIQPFNASHPLGNSYGEYQNYGGAPYYHPGIDIMAPAGTPVYAVKAGYVKAVLTIFQDLHWRVAIGDSSGAAACDGWLYAHLDEATIAVNEGDWVEEGQYLGDLVYWPTAGFHHLHFVKIRNSGVTWNSDWAFIANPLDELGVIDDGQPPLLSNATASSLFAFCQNEAFSYFSDGDPLAGDVDIICRADDEINHFWLVAPYELEYKIEGDSSIPWTVAVRFSGYLDYDQNVNVVYQDDGYLNSKGDYDDRVFYFNLTNTDGDGIIEYTDRARSWQTAYFRNGDYMIYARARDRFGNVAIDSMPVTVRNLFVLSGAVTYDDGNPHADGAVVTVLDDDLSDTTSLYGEYTIAAVGGGSQTVRYARAGYETVDTSIMMSRHREVNVVLYPAAFVLGDVDHDSVINVGDAVYLITYIFRGGPCPVPYAAGDANSDDVLNLGDAVYLIDYIFRGGPPPGGS